MIRMPETKVEYTEFKGGLDLVDPVFSIKPGVLLDCLNYEPGVYGGYKRIDGYERFDGHPRPSDAQYWLMPCTITGVIAVGDTVTGAVSGETGKVLQVNTDELVLGRVTGTFNSAESITIGGTPVATTTGATISDSASTGNQSSVYHALAADDRRADIAAVPGSGNILGAVMYNDVVYAWRNNAGGTAAVMYKSTASGWAAVTMPSEITYSAGHDEPAESAVILGLTSGATATVRRVVNRTGSWGTTSAGTLVVDTITGTFAASEVLADNVDNATVTVSSKISTVTITIASPAVITWVAHGLSADDPVVFSTTGALPTGITAGVTYYVISAGLTADDFEISDTIGGAAINTSGTQSGTHSCTTPTTGVVTWTGHGKAENDAVAFTTTGALPTGLTAGTVYYVLSTGLTTDQFQLSATLGGTPILTSGSQSGTHTGYQAYVTSSTTATQIALSPSGRYEFDIANFYGQQDKTRLYGADGVNPAFEFDGTYLVPIHTGMTVDAPSHVIAHKKHLFLMFESSNQHSSIGDPYAWSPVTGASEIALGEVGVGYAKLPGDALGIFTRNTTYQLLGSSSADWVLNILSQDTGAIPHTIQNIGYTYSLDDRGIVRNTQSLKFGNFESDTISRIAQPLIDALRPYVVASAVYRKRNQYRLYCSDGRGIIIAFEGTKVTGITRFEYTDNITCAWSGEDSTGTERVFLGDDSGFVYEAGLGSSFDGDAIDSFLLLPYNTLRSPRYRKQYRKIVLEMTSVEYSEISFYPEFSFGDIDIAPHPLGVLTFEPGAGGFWDASAWDTFYYDGKSTAMPEYSIAGAGNSLSILFYSRSAIDLGHTLNGMMVHYTVRRISR